MSIPSVKLSKTDIHAKLTELGIEGTTRAEALDLADHFRLCEVFG